MIEPLAFDNLLEVKSQPLKMNEALVTVQHSNIENIK